METECSKPNCSRPVRTRGMCKSHYETWRLSNRSEVAVRKSKWNNEDGTRQLCHYADCAKPVSTQGMCKHHYQNFFYESTRGAVVSRKNRKLTDYDGVKVELVCTFQDCNKPEFNPGFCAGHYYQKQRSGVMTTLHLDRACNVVNCEELVSSKRTRSGLCAAHSALSRKYSLTAEKLSNLYSDPKCSNLGCGETKNLHVDHDHSCCPAGKFGTGNKKSCGKCVRGWLCRGCNMGLGNLQESPQKIRGLLEYIESFKPLARSSS